MPKPAPAPAPEKPAADPAKIAHDLQALRVPIDGLVPDPANIMRHDDAQVASLKASLERFGQMKPVVVQKSGRVIRAGNCTVESARRLGWKTIAAVVEEMDDTTARAYSIADNQIPRLAEWDTEALKAAIHKLGAGGVDLAVLGFGSERLGELLAPDITAGEVPPAPLPPDNPVTQRGDLVLLGDHRLLCGDSSKPEDVDRLLDGHKVHLVNTDPPYNVKVEPRSNNAIRAGLSSFKEAEPRKTATHHQGLDLARHPKKNKPTGQMRAKDRPLENDFMTDEAFDLMLDAWFGNLARVLVPGGSFYIWGGYANCANYPPVLKRHKMYFAQAVIWHKMHPVLTRKDFMGDHEWCFYGWREGAGHKFYGPANVPDVWQVKKVNPQSMVHLTEKPVDLAKRAVEYSSRAGDNVLDLFGGSGSTMMACEATGRRCYSMELDPAYCDVIVGRWEQFTGRKATRVPAPKRKAG